MKIDKFTVVISVLTVGILAYGVSYIANEKFFMTDQEYIERYGITKNGDTVVLEQKQIKPQFPQAIDIFQDFKSNKVAFDKKYNEKLVEFEGEISEITTNWGCASIKIRAGESGFDVIECGNCPAGEDRWSSEVANVVVGQTVRIKGYYSASLSESYYISLYKCHIIQ